MADRQSVVLNGAELGLCEFTVDLQIEDRELLVSARISQTTNHGLNNG